MSAAPPPLAPDLVAGLKRLKLSRVRALAPEVLAAAKIQRWAPEEVLRTLVEAEIAGRDEANERNRLRVAGFPVTKTLEQFQRAHSSIPGPTLDYLGSLEWVGACENLCLIGPAGTGKSHCENDFSGPGRSLPGCTGGPGMTPKSHWPHAAGPLKGPARRVPSPWICLPGPAVPAWPSAQVA